MVTKGDEKTIKKNKKKVSKRTSIKKKIFFLLTSPKWRLKEAFY